MALIKGKQLASGTIDTRELKDDAVTVGKIADTQITVAKLDISGGAWDFSSAGSFSIPAPSADAHAATKAYVDASSQGLDVKESVRAASTDAPNRPLSTSLRNTSSPTASTTRSSGMARCTARARMNTTVFGA